MALFLPDWYSRQINSPYLFLILGLISFSGAVVATCTGKSLSRFGRVIRRAQKPKQFWCDVAIGYLAGVCFVGYFLYKVHAP
jgi:hypothetical protein